MNYLFSILNKVKSWGEAKVNHTKQPLTRENAYVMASINKRKGQLSDVFKKYQDMVLEEIERAASEGCMYLLVDQPPYIVVEDREGMATYLTDLGYTIHFYNEDILLVSWKYELNTN